METSPGEETRAFPGQFSRLGGEADAECLGTGESQCQGRAELCIG